ncbi:MAG: response regulator transcription factor [Gracilibacteraceae bacterium]|jgi:DNA-binding response OmpR family regulator|nr:response regulator transcription factor [Gracilibacteraceae bacterium]
MSGTILLVEDNELIQANNKAMLSRNGYDVRLAMTLAEARRELERELPGVVVLDITLPDGNGLDFLRELRQSSQIPVLLLTAWNTDKSVATGLDAGGDDYLAKPYKAEEFRARVDALMRRAGRVPAKVACGGLVLDINARVATYGGKDLLLTQKEFGLLLSFVQNKERFLSTEFLFETVWRAPVTGENGAVRKTVSSLRGKIKGCDWVIAWSKGEGYCFELM